MLQSRARVARATRAGAARCTAPLWPAVVVGCAEIKNRARPVNEADRALSHVPPSRIVRIIGDLGAVA
jgi:hypothetical protein